MPFAAPGGSAATQNTATTDASKRYGPGYTFMDDPYGSFALDDAGLNPAYPGEDVTGQNPWETDTRPNLFWSNQAPALNWDIDFSSLSRIPGLHDFADDAARVEQTTMDRATSLLDPIFDRREGDMYESLANRGLPAGASANTIQRDQFGRDYASAYEGAAMDSVLAGRQEQSRLFDMGLRSHASGLNDQLQQIAAGNSARSQAWGEQMGARGQLYQELMGQLGTSDFDPYASLTQGGMDPTNFLGALLSGGSAGSNTFGTLGGILGGMDWSSLFSGGAGGDGDIPVGQDAY